MMAAALAFSSSRFNQQGTPSSAAKLFQSVVSSAPSFLMKNTKRRGSSTLEFQYTHLEVNGMLWKVPRSSGSRTTMNNANDDDVSLVIDPLASELNFGIPWGYRAQKTYLDEEETLQLIRQANPSHCLLSQGLDDHTHLATLARLIELLPDLQFVVAPSAYDKIRALLLKQQSQQQQQQGDDDGGSSSCLNHRIVVLAPGQSVRLQDGVQLQATQGALVGPPWQARENGWLLQVNDTAADSDNNNNNNKKLAIYYEPHADVIIDQALTDLQADICISPVTQQSLPAQVPAAGQYTLVYGPQQTLDIACALGAKVVIPLANAQDLELTGPFTKLVAESGGYQEFCALVEQENEKRQRMYQQQQQEQPESTESSSLSSSSLSGPRLLRVERPTPGVPLKVQL